jgi:hypothetical protein
MAKESSEPDVVAAAMSKPGVILRRPVGSGDLFKEHAELPTNPSNVNTKHQARTKAKKPSAGTRDGKTTRKAVLAFEQEEKRRERERRKEEAAREKKHARRRRAVAKAQAVLEKAEREYERRAAIIDAGRRGTIAMRD